jgi:hypothetical protein
VSLSGDSLQGWWINPLGLGGEQIEGGLDEDHHSQDRASNVGIKLAHQVHGAIKSKRYDPYSLPCVVWEFLERSGCILHVNPCFGLVIIPVERERRFQASANTDSSVIVNAFLRSLEC